MNATDTVSSINAGRRHIQAGHPISHGYFWPNRTSKRPEATRASLNWSYDGAV